MIKAETLALKHVYDFSFKPFNENYKPSFKTGQ